MSPSAIGPNDILTDENYFSWEFNARMALARKELLDHVSLKPEQAMVRETAEWKAADVKALAILTRLLSPTYQSLIREAKSAAEAWETLREFCMRQSLHNRIQLRRQLHEFRMATGDNLMEHLLHFDDLCLRLAAVGDVLAEDEKLVVLLGSLAPEYDSMVKIIESQGSISLLEAKEMLRREYDSIVKREKTEDAFKAVAQRRKKKSNQLNRLQRRNNGRDGGFKGQCFQCKQFGHKRAQCPNRDTSDEFVFSVADAAPAEWILDSGASSHMTYELKDFCEYRSLKEEVTVCVADGNRSRAEGVGSVRLKDQDGRIVTLTEVIHVPELDRKLVSVPMLASKGVKMVFAHDACTLEYGDELVTKVPRSGKLFAMKAVALSQAAKVSESMGGEAVALSVQDEKAQVLHARLGHVGPTKMKLVMEAGLGVPMTPLEVLDRLPCAGCACGKMKVADFKHTSGSQVKTSRVLELVHSDVMGPMTPRSKGGSRFIVTFVDDFSRFVCVYPMKAKAEVLERFKEFKSMMEGVTGSRVRCLRSDNGGEYCSKQFQGFCLHHGIIRQMSTPYTPQQNGLAERMNRTLMEMTRSMLYHMQMEKHWWGEALMTAAYIVNRIPNTARPDKTPFEVVYNLKPSLDGLHVFGSRGFVYVDKSKRKKLDTKAHPCIFLGYADGVKGYRVWDTEEDRLVITRSIRLLEEPPSGYLDLSSMRVTPPNVVYVDADDVTPVAPVPTDSIGDTEPMDVDVSSDSPSAMDVDESGPPMPMLPDVAEPPASQDLARFHAERSFDTRLGVADHERALSNGDGRELAAHPSAALEGENRLVFPGVSERSIQSQRWRSLMPSGGGPQLISTQPVPMLPPSAPNQDSAIVPVGGDGDSDIVPFEEPPNKRVRLDDGYEVALACGVPTSYSEAMSSPDALKWKDAIRSEIRSHVKNHTWDLVAHPRDAKVIGCKWVFAHKYDENGNICRYKARLVARGYLQTHGVDYDQTYAPVASMNSIRVFLAVCCKRGYAIKQFDVETAFLNGDLEETVFMQPPEGIRTDENLVCKLRRSLYGLKQAANVWFKTIRAAFVEMGLVQSRADPCIFILNGDHPVYVLLYVDDLLIGCLEPDQAGEIAANLSQRFKLKSLGDAKFVLGMEIEYSRERGVLLLKQSSSVRRLVERFRQDDAAPVRSPNVVGQDLNPDDKQKVLANGKRFRELIGSLLYIANCTRPDIAVSVSVLSQFMDQPHEMHWRGAIRVLRYLKGTEAIGIVYKRESASALGLIAYSDANWGSDSRTRRSTSGVLVKMAGAPVIYKSKRQSTVALSSAEAEYIALALAVQEVVWLRHLLHELHEHQDNATTILVDNKSAISIATNAGYTARAKHIDLRVHFVRDLVEEGAIQLQYVPTTEQQADFLTKAIPAPQLVKLRSLCGLETQA